MLKKYIIGSAVLALLAAGSTATMVGCGKKKTTTASGTTPLAEGSSITIAGSLNLTGTGTSLSLDGTNLVDVSTLKVYCVSFSVLPVAGTGTVNADGSFSLTLAAAQVAVGCFILDSTEAQLGSIVFKNPAKTNMDGSAKTATRQAFSGAANLGAITLDLDTGKAEVDVSKITTTSLKDTTTATAAAYDFSGTYVIADAGIPMPTGYSAPCPAGQKSDDCHGPSLDEPLWVKRITGKSVADSSPVYGIMVWENEAKFTACGSRLGISYADAKAHGGVDLSGSGIPEGAFTWDSGYADGWKSPTATARNGLMKMENVADFKGYPGTKQYFKQYHSMTCGQSGCAESQTATVADGFMFNANTNETGCRVNGKPYQLQDWSGMSNCTNETTSGGLRKNTCTKTVLGVGTVTCINIGGMFNVDGSEFTTQNAMVKYPDDFDVLVQGSFCTATGSGHTASGTGDTQPMWNGNTQSCGQGKTLVAGQTCASMSVGSDDQKALVQLRCYGDAFQSVKDNPQANICVRDIQTNFSAKNADEFVDNNGPQMAVGEHIFEQFNYDSPTSGSFANEKVHYQGIQDGNNWTDCKVIERFAMSLRKIDGSNDLMAEMVQESRNASPKPACVSQIGAPKTMKSIFKFKKQ